MTNRFPNPNNQFSDDTGLPYAGGFLYFYASGTSTPLATYNDPDLAAPHANTNPIVLDSAGRTGPVFLQNLAYKVTLADSNDVPIWTADPVYTSDFSTVAQFLTYAGNPNGNVAGTAGTGTVPSSVIWDRTNNVLYVCTTTGTASTAVWTSIGSSFPGAIVFSSVITPTILAADTNNWAPTGFSTAYAVRASASSAISLTGLAGGATGRDILLSNIGSFNITLVGNSTSSSAGNRFLNNAAIVLRPGEGLSLSFDGTSNGWRVKSPQNANPPASVFSNLVITGTSNTQATLTARAITLLDSNGATYRALNPSLTIDITVSGANGLDTGAEASNTWYSVWAIYSPASNTVAGLFSTSATSPTLPSGYTFSARFGWVRNDGSSNLWRSLQYGNLATIVVGTNPTVAPVVASGTQGTYSNTSPVLTAASLTSFAPSTASSVRIAIGNRLAGATISSLQISSTTAWGGTNRGFQGSASNVPQFVFNNGTALESNFCTDVTLETTSIAVASSAAGGAFAILGWTDNI